MILPEFSLIWIIDRALHCSVMTVTDSRFPATRTIPTRRFPPPFRLDAGRLKLFGKKSLGINYLDNCADRESNAWCIVSGQQTRLVPNCWGL